MFNHYISMVLAAVWLCNLVLPLAREALSQEKEHQPIPCTAFEVPLEMPSKRGSSSVANIGIVNSSLTLSMVSFPTAKLTLRNDTGKPLRSVILLVTYFDGEGLPLFSIPFVGNLGGTQTNIPPSMCPFIRTVWNGPIRPGEIFSVEGSNLIYTSVRPVSSKATRIELAFAGESGSGPSVLQAWDGPTDPLPEELPEHLELSRQNVPPIEEALLDLTIDAEGRVLGVSPHDKEILSPELFNDLRREFMKWSFFPATNRGYSVQANLTLWIKFHLKKLPLPYPVCPQTFSDAFPRTFARVDLQYEKEANWNVSYGGYPASGKFQSIESISKGN